MEDLNDFIIRDPEKYIKIDALAKNVMTISRNTLLVNLRFLDMALSQFELLPTSGILATDGHYLLYDPRIILIRYREEKEIMTHFYLHMLMHCIFRHMFVGQMLDKEYWNLACDIAVEASIIDLQLDALKIKRQTRQLQEIEYLKSKVNILTAEKLYNYFRDNNISNEKIKYLSDLFKADEHELWYMSGVGIEKISMSLNYRQNDDSGENKDDGNGESDDNQSVNIVYGRIVKNKGESQKNGDGESDGESNGKSGGKSNGSGVDSQIESLFSKHIEADWKTISERMQTDMETFGKSRGIDAGGLTQNLQAVNREKYDYTSFLKKFATMGEAMKINDDEFDYILYTYGLKVYGKVPLIEPLEYKDVKRIREFVIAIDTSGSTSGDLVQKFLQKTYNILKTSESFFTKINLHIIQCDAEIQEDAKITNQEEFDKYLETMKIRGLGGTDFRPVFSYVDQLIKDKEFRNLKGLIYFTDGYGVFPQKQPPYDTAFVFIEDDYGNPDVPSWAIKLVLQSDEV